MSIQVFSPDSTLIAGTMLIEASAGTGKTYALERIVARLIGREENPLGIDSILVVTFTNRAAAEMKERIRNILGQRAKELERPAAERERYRAALSDFDSAAICTIHSFCRMALGTWPFESSAPFQQELVPGGRMELEEARAWMASPELNTISKAALRAAREEAGSGEKLIENTVRFMLDESTPPGAILLPNDDELEAFQNFLADANNPVGRLMEAAKALFGTDWNDVDFKALFKAAGGPNKKANSLERIRAHLTACRALHGIALSEAVFADPAEVSINNHFIDLLYAAHTLPDEENLPETGAARLLAALKAFIAAFIPFIEFRDEARGTRVVNLVGRFMLYMFYHHAEEVLLRRVEQRRLKEGNWGYADLIRGVSRAVTQPESPLTQALRRRFRAALIDEFQDTDSRQWQIFHDVFHLPGHLLVLIGDPKQSIYGFRGTGLQSYYAVRSVIAKNRVYHLDTNYRSRPALTASVNHLFAPLFRHSTDGNAPIEFLAVKPAPQGFRKLVWTEAETPIALIKAADEEEYAAAIALEIRALLDPVNGARWEINAKSYQALSASEIAVLVRAARHEDDIIGRLAALGVPAIRYRSLSVFTQPIIPAIKGLLQAIDNPRSQGLWRAVLLDSFFRLPADLLTFYEEAGYLDEFAEKGMELRELFLRGQAIEALESFFQFAVCLGARARSIGSSYAAGHLEQPWTWRVLAEPGGERTWQDWRQICELIQQKQFEGLDNIPGILRWLSRCARDSHEEGESSSVRLETESSAVRVMTMHAAKGLEFPLVFLYGGFAGNTKRGRDKPYRFHSGGHLTVDRLCREKNYDRYRAYVWEEEKRLWYVAFTRAAWKLWAPLPDGNKITQIDSLLYTALQNEPAAGELPPHETLGSEDSSAFRDKLRSSVQVFSVETGCVHICEPRELAPPLPPSADSVSGKPAPLPEAFVGDRDPALSSFTALIHYSKHGNRIDSPVSSDEGADEDVVYSENLPLPDDKGPVFGTLVHACFEQCDFALARKDEASWHEESDTLFRELAGRYYPPDWYRSRGGALKALVRRALRSPVPELGRLCDVDESCCRREVDFQIYVPETVPIPLPELEQSLEKGFLTGVIDLLIRIDKRWWIVDWKTNVPQAGEDYADIMNRHHYHLQYELYLLGLCRTLSAVSGEPVDWKNSIGGAVYLFLRGLSEHDDSGICVNKPSLELMQELSRSMGRILR